MDNSTMIRLEEVTKQYPGLEAPVVDRVTMDIPKGEIVVLVGPSGCGKTTTLKMINRLIEPTSGRIFIDGEDVTDADPDALRRRIGFVIQQIGLFPHMTIAENIALVPKMLKWETKRINKQIDTLLDMIGLDPSIFRDRYPKQLSGGQQQRIGVARALAADPPVLLMDEPFGAVDPIVRERLQNELLRIQAELRKTIVFVTHDIDEAIRLGDRIAILREQSRIAQYASPNEILSNPANKFVSDFIGAGATIKRLSLLRVRDVAKIAMPIVHVGDDAASVRQALSRSETGTVLLLDREERPQRWIEANNFANYKGSLEDAGTPADPMVNQDTTLHVALDDILTSSRAIAIGVDDHGQFHGVVTLDGIMDALRSGHHDQAAHKLELPSINGGIKEVV